MLWNSASHTQFQQGRIFLARSRGGSSDSTLRDSEAPCDGSLRSPQNTTSRGCTPDLSRFSRWPTTAIIVVHPHLSLYPCVPEPPA